ncbi:MAG: ABC transporter ATP-binding protein [Chloroflexota bacterium]|nr:ABC transporter ATP-binding protein [Chloroflexota bacterium]
MTQTANQPHNDNSDDRNTGSRALLQVEDLTMSYYTQQGEVRAVDGVSFSVERGQGFGLVGESGCGKSSIALSLLKILPESARISAGSIVLDGLDLVPLSEDEMREYRWARVSMVFQAAMNSLDPVYRVGDQIIEALEYHVESAPAASVERVRELYDLVNLDTAFIPRYPHEYSGGMKQRAIIAMALACEPDLIIADEPTTALDVIVQDRILREMKNVQRELDMGMIYISHDMAVIAEVSDVVGVMYAGKIVEFGSVSEIFNTPIHPYTRALMSAFPSVTGEKRELATLSGEPPNLLDPPSGCRFHPRCPYATEECATTAPPLVQVDEHWAYCWNPPED